MAAACDRDCSTVKRHALAAAAAPEGFALGWDHHRFGGHGRSIQDDVTEEAGYAPGDRDGGDDWTLLLQLSCDDAVDVMFGDAGSVYWLARRAAVAAGDLSDARFLFQCS